MTGLGAVLFDLGGTLWEWYPGLTPEGILATVAPRALRLLPEAQAVLLTPESLAEAVRRTYLELEHAACDGDTSPMPNELCVRKALAGLGVTIDPATAEAMIDALYVSERETTRLLPFAVDALAALSASGLRLGIVSNRMYGGERLRGDLSYFDIGRYFDVVVTSAEVGQMKPHPALFRQALQELELSPDKVVMVGDDLCCDVAGALNSHLQAVWVRRPPERTGDPPAGVSSIKRLDELSEAIDRLR
jgi:putative hydrolase of the HAD superfamily